MRQLFFVEPGHAEWREAPDPKLEGPGEAIVRPLAVAACDLDAWVMRGTVPFEGPFALGHEFVGEVVDAGEEAGVGPGDRVIPTFQVSCGECDRCRAGRTANCTEVQRGSMYGVPAAVGGGWGGALADLVRVPYARSMLVPLPEGIEPAAVASLSDNVADGWRTVGPQLAEQPGAPVLIVGGGAHSISLYAVQIAAALGSEQVDFIDTDPDRLAVAERLGARPVEGPPPRKAGSYPITVNAGLDHASLHCAIRSTEPDGVCTNVGIYFEAETPLPLFEMYTRGIRLLTGRVNSSMVLPQVLELVTGGRLDPSAVTSRVVSFDEAPDALADPPTKLVVAR
jgi:threonine dehydrogenase-like Zn-dependent dehydrogenase